MTDLDRALAEVTRVAFFDVRALFDEHGSLRPIHELSEDVAAAIASIRIVRRNRRLIQKARFGDRAKALGMLLTHFSLLKECVHLNDEEVDARLEGGTKTRGNR